MRYPVARVFLKLTNFARTCEHQKGEMVVEFPEANTRLLKKNTREKAHLLISTPQVRKFRIVQVICHGGLLILK